MSKSILILDTPENCLDCPLGIGYCSDEDGEEVYCNILECTTYQKGIYEDEDEEELYNDKKPDWCPLKNVPEKKDVEEARKNRPWSGEGDYRVGYNACIDEILRGGMGNDGE